MKGALIVILFLLFSGWWGSGEEEYVRVEELQQEGMERVEAGKMDRQEDKVVRVLAEANRYAEVAVESIGAGIGQGTRRHRTGGGGWEKCLERLLWEQEVTQHTFYKTTEAQTEECAARLKSAGYYIYALRKILI